MRRRAIFGLVLAGVLLIVCVGAYSNDIDSAEAVNRTRGLALGVTVLFLVALVGMSFAARVDGFSLGSAVIAVLLQVIMFLGWLASPQEEADRFFLLASGLPFVLIAVTLLFNALQRES